MYINTYLCVYVRVNICVHMCVYVYMYIYMYIYTSPDKGGFHKIFLGEPTIKHVTFRPHMDAPDAPIPANCTNFEPDPMERVPDLKTLIKKIEIKLYVILI